MSRALLLCTPARLLADGSFALWPDSNSMIARRIDLVYVAMLCLTAFLVLLIGIMILTFVIKYRAASDTDRSEPVRRTTAVEITWVTVPLLLMLGVFFWGASVYFDVMVPPTDARTIYVVGKQWMWKVHHPSGRREINELHVPYGEPIRLVMTSQDVIHSLFIPAFRVKRDVLPGSYSTLWFQAEHPGEFRFACAEYCGADHSGMQGRVIVLGPADFQRWLSGGTEPGAAVPGTPGTPGASLAVRGRGPFFQFGCNACHVPGAAVRAPRLDGLFGSEVRLRSDRTVIADEAYIRESILEPNAKITAGYDEPSLMPTYRGQITEEQIIELTEFIKSLRNGWPEEISK